MVPRSLYASLALVLAAALGGCGEPEKPKTPAAPPTGGPLTVEAPPSTPAKPPPPPEPTTPAERTKARLAEFFQVARAGDPAAAAPFVVYRGEDPARRWKDLSNYAAQDEKKRVEEILAKARKHLASGAPRFLTFRSERESEGTWLAWEVAFGEGEGAKKATYACLEVKGTIALGDIDTD